MYFQYRCSLAETCANTNCRHINPHLARRLTIEKGNYVTCATRYNYCSQGKDFAICEHIKLEPQRPGYQKQVGLAGNQASPAAV